MMFPIKVLYISNTINLHVKSCETYTCDTMMVVNLSIQSKQCFISVLAEQDKLTIKGFTSEMVMVKL